MRRIFTLAKYDYLQRVRSYRFLIIFCASLAFAYTLIPAPGDTYSTVRIGEYLGNYNSAWIGYVTAIMASTFVSLIGYYLINNSVKVDQDTKVGQIVAATRISNFRYLLAKFLGNFLILLTIVILIFLVGIVLFFMYGSGYPFQITEFLTAYILIPIPTIVLISALAVVLEVFLAGRSALQNVAYFFLFAIMLVQGSRLAVNVDPFGVGFPTSEMESQVAKITTDSKKQQLNIGFIIGQKPIEKRFDFNGVPVSPLYITFRLLWPLFGILLIYVASRFFHRFEVKERLVVLKKTKSEPSESEKSLSEDLDLTSIPKLQKSMSIFPVFKTELLMMIRRGNRWLWGLNIIGMVLLAVLPLEAAHKIVLPILWFLQVHRWADLVTKEKNHQMHFFIFSSFKPAERLLTAQWLAAVALAIGLVLPLIIRYLVLGQWLLVVSILIGAVFIILVSSFIGILTGGKRLFEVLFFFTTYMNVNGLPYTDYYGSINNSHNYLFLMFGLTFVLALSSFLLRRFELKKV